MPSPYLEEPPLSVRDPLFFAYWVALDAELYRIGSDASWPEEARRHFNDGTTASDAAEAIADERDNGPKWSAWS